VNDEVFQDDAFHPLYSGQSYAPVMDLTEPHFRDVFQFYRGASDAVPADWYASGFGPPENQNAPRGARSTPGGARCSKVRSRWVSATPCVSRAGT
jgi:hypothetical protein